MSEIVPIVNNGDVIVGAKARNELLPEDTYRVVGLWVVNQVGDILLARRQEHKQQQSGRWDTAAAGTVLDGESYEQAMQRETREELGLTDLQLTERAKLYVQDKPSYFCQTFTTVLASGQQLAPDHTEVSAVKWFTHDRLLDELAQSPHDFTPGVVWAVQHLQN